MFIQSLPELSEVAVTRHMKFSKSRWVKSFFSGKVPVCAGPSVKRVRVELSNPRLLAVPPESSRRDGNVS